MPSLYDKYELEDSTSQIRLLELVKNGEGKREWAFVSPIQLQKLQSSVPFALQSNGNPATFAAISYEWGDAKKTKKIKINRESMEVRENLWDFLDALPRLKEKESSLPSYFWIDALCIDQKNKSEKTNQIRLLRAIYKSATCVLSWLRKGPHAGAMEYLIDKSKASYSKEDFYEFLDATYWTRVWIVQEVVLAPEWWIACGDRIVNGDELSKFLKKRKLDIQGYKANNIINERRNFDMKVKSPLIVLLCRFFDLQSTYPVDKIRGLLALCSDNTEEINKLLARFDDQTQTFGRTYREKSKLCDEIMALADLSGMPKKGWARKACRDLVAGVLGVNLPHVASSLEMFFVHKNQAPARSLGTRKKSSETFSEPPRKSSTKKSSKSSKRAGKSKRNKTASA